MRTARLPWRTKAGFGAAELGFTALEVLVQVYLLKFYNDVVGLPPAWTGAALAAGILWDAVTDPLMGGISDRTRSARGRRRVYFLPGTLVLAVLVVLLFNPPELESHPLQFAWLLLTFMALNTASTVVAVPYVALAGELTFDRDERTSVFGYRRLAGVLGLVVGTVLPAVFLAALGGDGDPANEARSRGLTGVSLAPVLLLGTWVTLRATRGLDRPAEGGGEARRPLLPLLWELFRAQRHAWRNPVFLPLLAAFVIAAVGRTLNGSIALYYYEYRLELAEEVVVPVVLLPFFLCLLVAIPAWVAVSRRFGKRGPAFLGALGLSLIHISEPTRPY